MPVILGCPDFFLCGLVCGESNRNVVREVASADDHCAGVDSDLSHAAFQLDGIFQDFLDEIRPFLEFVLEFRKIFDAVFQIGLELLLFLDLFLCPVFLLDHFFDFGFESRFVRDHLGQSGCFIYRQAADSGHILDGAFGSHGAECDDMGNMIFAVCLLNVLESTVTAFIIEIDVNIRHGDTVRIQETLKQEVVLDRVEVGDFQTVGHD